MGSDELLAEMAREVGSLKSRVHMLESLTRPQAKQRIAEIFQNDVAVAVGLLVEQADTQTGLAKLVAKSIGRPISQRTMSRELNRLRGRGVLRRSESAKFLVEDAWKEIPLDAELRVLAKRMSIKIAPKRRRRKTTH